jgi:hypothetical protein
MYLFVVRGSVHPRKAEEFRPEVDASFDLVNPRTIASFMLTSAWPNGKNTRRLSTTLLEREDVASNPTSSEFNGV